MFVLTRPHTLEPLVYLLSVDLSAVVAAYQVRISCQVRGDMRAGPKKNDTPRLCAAGQPDEECNYRSRQGVAGNLPSL